jgi:hypothetical protein
MPRVYLSYSHKDATFVGRLAGDLRDAGVDVWLDERELRVGEMFVETLRNEIAQADYVAVALTPDAVVSEWVQQEIELALSLEAEVGHPRLLPLLIADCQIPRPLQHRKYADFRRPLLYLQVLKQLLTTIGVSPTSAPVMVPGTSRRPGRRWSLAAIFVVLTALIAVLLTYSSSDAPESSGGNDPVTTILTGSLRPPPAIPADVRILAEGEMSETSPDGFGRFELPVTRSAGETVRLKIYSRGTLIYDEYQTLPGPVVITLPN